jgi:phage protein D/phage baseplate assembly protein gpV
MIHSDFKLAQVTVQIAGRSLTEAELSSLTSIRIQQKLSLPALCELTFASQFGKKALISHLIAGLSLQIDLPGELSPLFSGEVTALEYYYSPDGPQTLRVRGYDILHRLRKRRQVRAFVQTGLSELASELVADLSLTVQGSVSEVTWRRVIQHGQSDLELLREKAAACGLYFTLQGSELFFLSLEGAGNSVPLAWGDDLLEARIEANGDPCCRIVSAEGWNTWMGSSHYGKADQARSGRDIAAEMPPERVNGEGDRSLVGLVVENDRAAEALAQADLDTQVAREVTLWGAAQGNVRLQPGVPVEISGVALALAGRYVLTEVVHSFTSEGKFTTEFSTCPPPSPKIASGMTALLGKVSNVNDPEHLGRVQVTLSSCGDVESDWLQVVAAAGGRNKGLMMLPDVGDLVLLLCFGADPAQGVVLGGIFGPAGPLDAGVEGSQTQRFTLRTASGHLIQFDDANKVVQLTDSSGSTLELKPGKVRLQAVGDLDIAAPGKSIVIRGKSINFEEA